MHIIHEWSEDIENMRSIALLDLVLQNLKRGCRHQGEGAGSRHFDVF